MKTITLVTAFRGVPCEDVLCPEGAKAAEAFGRYLAPHLSGACAFYAANEQRAYDSVGEVLKGASWGLPVNVRPELNLGASSEMLLQGLGRFVPDHVSSAVLVAQGPVVGSMLGLLRSEGVHPERVFWQSGAYTYDRAKWDAAATRVFNPLQVG